MTLFLGNGSYPVGFPAFLCSFLAQTVRFAIGNGFRFVYFSLFVLVWAAFQSVLVCAETGNRTEDAAAEGSSECDLGFNSKPGASYAS